MINHNKNSLPKNSKAHSRVKNLNIQRWPHISSSRKIRIHKKIAIPVDYHYCFYDVFQFARSIYFLSCCRPWIQIQSINTSCEFFLYIQQRNTVRGITLKSQQAWESSDSLNICAEVKKKIKKKWVVDNQWSLNIYLFDKRITKSGELL